MGRAGAALRLFSEAFFFIRSLQRVLSIVHTSRAGKKPRALEHASLARRLAHAPKGGFGLFAPSLGLEFRGENGLCRMAALGRHYEKDDQFPHERRPITRTAASLVDPEKHASENIRAA